MSALATGQCGVVCRRQLLALGLTSAMVERRVAAGALLPIHAGVYAVAHRALPRGWREWAAVLACGADAALAHRSAGAWLGMLGWWNGPVHVTVPRSTGLEREGIVVHRCRTLVPGDLAEHAGLRCTSPARTLLDLAASEPRLLGRALREAEVQRLDIGNVHALLAASPRRRGARALHAALEAFDPRAADARSPLEHDALDLLAAAGLPPARANALVEGHLVDLLWPDHRLIVELDGRAAHATRGGFEADRRRDNALQLAGFLVLRFTRRRLREEPAEVVREVAAALGARAGAAAAPGG